MKRDWKCIYFWWKIGLIFLKVGINCSLLKPGFSGRLRNCSIWCYMVYVQFGKKKMDDCIFKLKHIVQYRMLLKIVETMNSVLVDIFLRPMPSPNQWTTTF